MSEFGYHLLCETCGLESPDLPFRADRASTPPEVALPMADRKRKQFAVFRFALESEQIDLFLSNDKKATEYVLLRAENLVSADTVVSIPSVAIDGPVLKPRLACPRCNSAGVVGVWGSPSSALPRAVQCDSLEAAVEAALEYGDDIVVGLMSGDKISRMQHFGKDRPFRWTVSGSSGEASLLAKKLEEILGNRGVSIRKVQSRDRRIIIDEEG